MKDLVFAKKILNEKNYTLCAVKNGQVVYHSRLKGITPLYLVYKNALDLTFCVCVDRVVGLGAAYIYTRLYVKYVHANIMSKDAYTYLSDHHIGVSADDQVEGIVNRSGDGFCPVETIAKRSNNFKDFIKQVDEFLESKNIL